MKINIRTFTGFARTYGFDVDPSTTIGQLKEMFCKKTNCEEDLAILCLTIQGEELEEDNKTLQDYILVDESTLNAMWLGQVCRGDSSFKGSRFIDFSKEKGPKRIAFATTAPRWRRSIRGLCLEGKCTTPGCDANGQYVVMRIGYKMFDILGDSDDSTTVCPICKKYVEPETCAFNNCWWRYQGLKEAEPGSGKGPTKVSSSWIYADDAYHRFEEEENGIVRWKRLVVEAVKDKPKD